jgi:hypothetical protein
MDVNAQLLETRWYQAENCLWLFDATGAAALHKPGIQKQLTITILSTLPKLHFSLINKGHRIAIMLPQHAGRNKEKSKDTLRASNPDEIIIAEQLPVTPAELQQGAALLTRIEGTLVDPSRQFNSRWFGRDLLALDAAHLEQNAIGLFRHTQATALSVGGSLRGNLQLESGEAVPWAIVSLSLQLQSPLPEEGEEPAPPAPIVLVQAQANQFGDFVLPLNELPAAEFDMPVPIYRAQLRVQRCAIKSDLPDPDDLQDLNVLELLPEDDAAIFAASISVDVRPGEHRQLYSHQQSALLVKPSG